MRCARKPERLRSMSGFYQRANLVTTERGAPPQDRGSRTSTCGALPLSGWRLPVPALAPASIEAVASAWDPSSG